MNVEYELKSIGLAPDEYENFLQDCADKIDGISDIDWSEIIEKYHLPYDRRRISESMGRSILGGNFVREFYKHKIIDKTSDEVIKELIAKEQDIYKAKRKLQDERTGLNKLLRDEARYEENFRLLEERLQTIGEHLYPITLPRNNIHKGYSTMIVNLSDLHIGASFDNSTGKFNSEIARDRLGQYLNEIKIISNRHECNKCVVNILGDCISGNIHPTVQIANRENAVEQIMLACELITEFIASLNTIFNQIEVYSVPGNHSRLDKNKDNVLLGERLDNIIPWYINNIFAHNKNIEVGLDQMDETYSTFMINGKEYLNIHGDFDGLSETAIQRLCSFIGRFPYAVIMGHKHHIAMNEVSGIKVIQCGSLCGSGDEFTIKSRLSGKASQTVLVCNNKGIEAIYPVELE